MAKATEIVEHDLVNHPPHYRGVEIFLPEDVIEGDSLIVNCIDVIENMADVRLASALRYIWRVDEGLGGGKDDNEQDIEKAIWYLCRYLGRVPEIEI